MKSRCQDAAWPLSLEERQAKFAAAILDPERAVPEGLVDPSGEVSLRGFSVYRNNVVVGLIEALKAAFPAVQKLVGDEFFAAMARSYASLEPPRSPIMLEYGAGFPDFVSAFGPAATLPYLRDVARLERAWLEAYHAAERAPVDPGVFHGIKAKDLARVRLDLHPSLRIVRSPFPVVSLWKMNIEGGVPEFLDVGGGGEDALVVRPSSTVEVRRLSSGTSTFLEALAAGAPIASATMIGLGDDPRFDLFGALTDLLRSNAVVGWH